MDLRMPDGTLITGVPDNVNKADVIKRYQAYNAPQIADDGRVPTPFSDEGPIGLPALAPGQARMQEDKLSPLQELLNIGKRGAGQINEMIAGAGYGLGAYDPASFAERMRINQREYQAAAPSQGIQEGMGRLQQANTTGNFTDVLAAAAQPENYPALASLVAESAISSAPIIPMSVIGGILKGRVGAAVTTGLGSFGLEFGSAVGDLLDKKNIDSSDPVAVRRALDDPNFLEEVRDRAVKRGIPVATLDALSAGFAGKFITSFERALAKNAIKGTVTKAASIAAAKEAGLQVGAGMAGEKLAQAATGENKPLDVIMEGLAELPGGIGEVATNVRTARAQDQLRNATVETPAAPLPVKQVSPTSEQESHIVSPETPPPPAAPPVPPPAPPTPPAPPAPPTLPAAPEVMEEDENAPSQDRQAMLEEMGLAPKIGTEPEIEPVELPKPKESKITKDNVLNYVSPIDGEEDKIELKPENVITNKDGQVLLSGEFYNHPAEDVLKNTKDPAQRQIIQGLIDQVKAPEKGETPTVNLHNREIPVTLNKVDANHGDQLVNVNTQPFEEQFKKDESMYVGPEGTANAIKDRYPKFAEFSKTAPSIEAPNVAVNENGGITFGNGRHRYAYMRDQGLQTIPMAMDAESIKNAEKFGYIGEKAKPSKTLIARGLDETPFVADETDQKAIAVYKSIKAKNPDADVDAFIENPNQHLPVEEKPNPKNIKIGDLIYEKGNPDPYIAISVDNNAREIPTVQLIDPNTGALRGSAEIENISKEPIGHDYDFDFGKGKVNVDVSKWIHDKEYEIELIGPGVNDSNYFHLLGVVIKSKPGSKEFNDTIEEIAKANSRVSQKPLTTQQKNKKFRQLQAQLRNPDLTEEEEAELERQVAELTKPEPAKKEAHIEGDKSEPIKTKTIEKAVEKSKVDTRTIKDAITKQFDAAIAKSPFKTKRDWDSGNLDAYVNINIPGDGKFKIKNNVERLEEMKKKLLTASSVRGPSIEKNPPAYSSSAESALKHLIDENDMQAALEYAKNKDINLKDIKFTADQQAKLDLYNKNPETFDEEVQNLESEKKKQETIQSQKNMEQARERIKQDEERQKEARFKAILDTVITMSQPQLARYMKEGRVTSEDARRILDTIPNMPEGVVQPYVTNFMNTKLGLPTQSKTEIKKKTAQKKKEAKSVSEEEKIVDAIKDAAYAKNSWSALRGTKVSDFITKYGKPMFNKAVEMGLLDNKDPGERLFPSNKYVYDVANKYYDNNGKKLTVKTQEKSNIVVTPDNAKLSYPIARGLIDDGYRVLGLDDPRTYVDKGGKPHRTFEKDGVRLSVTNQLVLFQNKNNVQTGIGNPEDMVINALLVDKQKRGTGLATQALKEITSQADKNGVNLYIEPTPIVNIKEKDFGLDQDQLVNLYKKFGFEFQEDSDKVMQRAPQVADESNIIDGTDLIKEVGNEKQLLLISDESNKLTDKEKAVLEEEYGVKHGSNEFLERLHNDVFNFITNGANAIKNRIRPIINKIASSLLSVAMVLNPNFVTKPEIIAVPQYETRIETVYAEVPAEAKAKMSPAAQQIYSAVYPTLKEELMKNNKFFIVTDKPMARNFIFNPDGSLLMDKKVLLSKSMGDFLPSGSNNIDANKITPAGLYNLGLRDASRSKGEAETAGEYDYGKVFVIEHAGEGRHGPYSMTIMHSVWTHEKDAAQRLAALKTEAPNVSRYSFGCINVDKATFGELVNNHLSQMDGAKLFIVPDSATNAMDFVNGKATYSEDVLRQRVEPITKEIKTPVKEAKAVAGENLVGREENFYSVDKLFRDDFQEEKKRNPSFKRAVTGLNKARNQGKLTDEEFALRVGAELDADNNRKLNERLPPRNRGILHIKSRLNEEANRGVISKEAVDLAEWFMNQNPDLVLDLAISIKAGKPGVGGQYTNLNRLMTLMKNAGDDETPVHEILHHTERMMPGDIQNAIRKEWLQQLLKAQKNAKTQEEKVFFAAVMDSHFGDNRALDIEVKDKEGNVDKSVNKFMYDTIMSAKTPGESLTSAKLAKFLLQHTSLPIANYRFVNPSEFWAVNGSRIVAGDYAAVQGGILAKLKNWLGKLAEKIKSLFGFRSDAPILKALNSLSKSDGVFQSSEMLGGTQFESIYNYQGNPAPAATFDSPDDTKLDKFLRSIQDKHIDTKRLIETIKATGNQVMNDFNAYLKEELYHGRTASRINEFLRTELLPLVKEMDKYKIGLPELDKYLHFRHAKERNAENAKINPAFSDPNVAPGSGLKDSEVDTYFRTISPNRKKQLDLVAAKVDAIIKGTQEVLVDGGLEEQKTIDLWNKIYDHYVPLQRSEEELDFVNHGSGLGQGYGTKGKFSRPAYGSLKTVVDIFSNVALQRERAIIRSEKARVGKALYGMALQYPNPKFWLAVNPDAIKNKKKLYAELTSLGLTPADAANIIQEPKVATKDPVTGLVRYQVNPALRNSPNVFPVRINGKDRYIFFNNQDERAKNIVKAMKNLDTEQLNYVFGMTGDFTRWIASVNTQFNPVFGAWNFTRDVGGAAFNLSTTPIADKKTKVAAGIFPAMYAIYSDLRAGREGKKIPGDWVKWYDRFLKAGGATGYSEQFSRGRSKTTGERLETVVEKELSKLDRSNAHKAAASVFEWLSDYNDAMENAVRLSAFKVAVESGMTEEEAASLAKNLTVNFNRKGSASPTYQSLFAFFNASVQGTARLAETLQGPAGKKIIAGGIALGVFQAIALAMAGYDDDEPPQYLKDKNLIIPMPGGKYLIAPLPLGLNVLPGMGRIATEYFLGKMGLITGAKGAGSKVLDMLGLLTDTFNPLGGGSLIQAITPTVADPIIAIATNKDAFGRPISKQDLASRPTPGYTRSRENANVIAQGLAQFLNYASGGTKDVKGAVSPTADQITYLAGQYTGGVGREITKTIDTGKALLTGEDLPSYKVPIVGKLYGETSSPAAVQDKFYKNVVIMSEHEDTIKGMAKRHEDSKQYRAENPEARLWQQANSIENQVSALNKQRKILIERGAPQSAIDRNREIKTRLMNNFNERVKSLQRTPAQTANQ